MWHMLGGGFVGALTGVVFGFFLELIINLFGGRGGVGIKWGIIIGAVIGAIASIENAIKASDIKELKSQTGRMKSAAIYKELIAWDRANLMQSIRYGAKNGTTKDEIPLIGVYSSIPRNKQEINRLISEWGFQDLSDEQFLILKMAIAETDGYKPYGEDDFRVDEKYWQPYIDREIQRCRDSEIEKYRRDQSRKKSIF